MAFERLGPEFYDIMLVKQYYLSHTRLLTFADIPLEINSQQLLSSLLRHILPLKIYQLAQDI